MRNLKLVQHIEFHHPELIDTQYICVGGECRIIYCIDKSSIFGVDLATLQIVSQVSLEAEGFLDINANNVPLGMTYLLDQQLVCVATTNGDVILYNPLNKQLECVGTVESGLTAMGWSPDQELVVLTTGQSTVILMNKEFEGITEIPLHSEEFGENKSITVGWGKKETQFQGSVGKQAALATTQKAECLALPWDDLRPRISWREDGQYFVISAVNSDNDLRKIRVWSRDGILQSTSESVNGLEQSLSWKPSGGLIASSQCRANKHEIIFFEKNGLRHGEFTLPFKPKEVKVHEVLWNNDSSILAVWCEELNESDCKESNGCEKTYFQLWTVNNYHWYLKYNLHFQNIKVRFAIWDPEHAYRLHMMCQGGKYFQYTWFWQTNHSYGCNEDDLANVAVIDGSRVLVTPFRNLIIPPPMSAYQLLLPSPINHVIFAPPPQTNNIALVLASGKIVLYTSLSLSEGDVTNLPLDPTVKLDAAGGNGFKVQIATPRLSKVYDIVLPESLSSQEPLNLHHFLWILPGIMLCVHSTNSVSSLIQLDLKEKEGEETDKGEIILNTITILEGFVLGMCSNSVQTAVAIQLKDGAVIKYEPASERIMPWFDSMSTEVQFPQPCLEMAICNINGEDVVLGLTDRFRLYINNIEVANNCTSFRIHNEFLLLTTHNHTLRCIHKANCKLEYLKDNQAHVLDENIRWVERGSRLVVVVSQDTKVILQMPRGNLETIHPRTLALSVVCRHIDKLRYKEAFVIMRKHRINLNLLYDHNPKNFLQNVEQFILQLESVTYISLFLSDLVDDDVTLSMYKMAYSQREGVKQSGKVDIVCDALREAMENSNPNRYLLAILTAHTRKSKIELDLALMKIKALRDNNENQVADEAVNYLLYLVDVNELYNVALGTYDFDLVLMIAEKSQKDPKEYLPFLNNLQKYEHNYQRYMIDIHLKHYKKALQHISKCEDRFEECLTLVTTHALYLDALKLFSVGSSQYKDINIAYGYFLLDQKQYDDAALIFYRCKEFEIALEAYEKSRNWRQTLCMASLLNYSPNKLAQLAQSLAGSLKERHQYSEAAILLEQYVQDVEESIATLIEGNEWDEALRIMYKYNRQDIIETHLKGALLEQGEETLFHLDRMRETYERHMQRLAIVRDLKQRGFYDAADQFQDGEGDLYSDTSSITGSRSSVQSQYSGTNSKISGRSSKNRRKAERKKHSLKEGSPFEDVALIEALAEIIKLLDKIKDQIGSLLKTLFIFGYEKEAKDIQEKMEVFLKFVADTQSQIWIGEADAAQTDQVFGPNFTANMIATNMQKIKDASSPKWQNPALKYPPEIRKNVSWKLGILKS